MQLTLNISFSIVVHSFNGRGRRATGTPYDLASEDGRFCVRIRKPFTVHIFHDLGRV